MFNFNTESIKTVYFLYLSTEHIIMTLTFKINFFRQLIFAKNFITIFSRRLTIVSAYSSELNKKKLRSLYFCVFLISNIYAEIKCTRKILNLQFLLQNWLLVGWAGFWMQKVCKTLGIKWWRTLDSLDHVIFTCCKVIT